MTRAESPYRLAAPPVVHRPPWWRRWLCAVGLHPSGRLCAWTARAAGETHVLTRRTERCVSCERVTYELEWRHPFGREFTNAEMVAWDAAVELL